MIKQEDTNFAEVSELLEDDLDFLTDLRECDANALPGKSPNKTQAIRRLYIRVFVSVIEGSIASFKKEALRSGEELSRGEKMMLEEISYDVSSSGKIIIKKAHTPLLSSFRLALRMLEKVWGIKTSLDYSSEGWQAFQHTIDVRNRLTHPKDANGLRVSDEDMRLADKAEIWFRLAHGAMVTKHQAQLEQKIDLLKAEIQKKQTLIASKD